MSQILKDQSTHTGIALAVVIVLLAHVAGIDLIVMTENMTKSLAAIATLVGLASSFAKIGLPENVKSEASAILPTEAAASLGAAALRELADKLEKSK
jgi:purine-cytosine permease-like protein